jgi:hypothetical protein
MTPEHVVRDARGQRPHVGEEGFVQAMTPGGPEPVAGIDRDDALKVHEVAKCPPDCPAVHAPDPASVNPIALRQGDLDRPEPITAVRERREHVAHDHERFALDPHSARGSTIRPQP